jgi:hypothetical protein
MKTSEVWEMWKLKEDPRLFAVTSNKEYFFWVYNNLFQKVSRINNTGLCQSQKDDVYRQLEAGTVRIKHADSNEIFYVKDSINRFKKEVVKDES